MATPTVAKNKARVLKKWLAILFRTTTGGAAREATDTVGHATVQKTRNRVYVSAGVPAAGTDVSEGDVCLDTTNGDAYRYYDAWYKVNVEA